MGIPIEKPDFQITDSLLKIDGVHLPKSSAINITQEYQEDDLGIVERSLDGGLVFLGIPDLGFRVSTTISGEGSFRPNVFKYRRFQKVIIECAVPWYLDGYVDPEDFPRKHVPGSIRYYKRGVNGPVTVGLEGYQDDDNIVIQTSFRPMLQMVCVGSSVGAQEWAKRGQWRMDFIEDVPL